MSDYQINITKANGLRSYRWTVTDPDGSTHTDGRTYKAEWVARREALAHINSITGHAIPTQPATTAEPAKQDAPKGWSRHSRPAGQATVHQMMETTFGVSSPSYARGDCHYCGQKLNRRGYCEECD